MERPTLARPLGEPTSEPHATNSPRTTSNDSTNVWIRWQTAQAARSSFVGIFLWLIRLLSVWCGINFFVAVLVTCANIMLQYLLMMFADMNKHNPAVVVIIHGSQFVMITFIAYRILSILSKSLFPMWVCRFDVKPYVLSCFCCEKCKASAAMIVRSFIQFCVWMYCILSLALEDHDRVHDRSIFQKFAMASMFVGSTWCGLYFLASIIWKSYFLVVKRKNTWRMLLFLESPTTKDRRGSAAIDEAFGVYHVPDNRLGFETEDGGVISSTQPDDDPSCLNQQHDLCKCRGVICHLSFREMIHISLTFFLLSCSIWQPILILLLPKDGATNPDSLEDWGLDKTRVEDRRTFAFIAFFLPWLMYISLLFRSHLKRNHKFFDWLVPDVRSHGPILLKALLSFIAITGAMMMISLFIINSRGVPKGDDYRLTDWDGMLNTCAAKIPKRNRPVCNQRLLFKSVDIVDAAFLAKLVYSKKPWKIESVIDRYFDGKFRVVKKLEMNSPSYFVIQMRNETMKKYVVAVRGTTNAADWYEDLSLYSEVSSLWMFSYVIPIIHLWPKMMIQKFVERASFLEGSVFKSANFHYFDPIVSGVKNVLMEKSIYEMDGSRVLIVGHSLGGAVAHVVSARLSGDVGMTQSVGFASPGVEFSSRKFGVNSDLLGRQAMVVYNDQDLVPRVDQQGMAEHLIPCKTRRTVDCHSMTLHLCTLASECTACHFSREKATCLKKICRAEEKMDPADCFN